MTRKGRVPRDEWPAILHELGDARLRGVFIGGCICRGLGSSFMHTAHAHVSRCGCGKSGWTHTGWICIRGWKHFVQPLTPQDHNMLLHELAHILTGEGHNDEWRERATAIGCTLGMRYEKRIRSIR